MSLIELVFGCSHKRRSFPITTRGGAGRSEAAKVTGTYVVCLDCGKEFAYDWEAMKLIRNRPARGEAATVVSPQKVA